MWFYDYATFSKRTFVKKNVRIIKLRNKWLYSVSNIQKKKNNHVWIKILFVDQFWNKYIKWFGKQNMQILDVTAIYRSFVKTVSQLKICWFFRRKGWKVLKRYNFLWVQRRHNCSPAASFANCVMTLYLLKVESFPTLTFTRLSLQVSFYLLPHMTLSLSTLWPYPLAILLTFCILLPDASVRSHSATYVLVHPRKQFWPYAK